MQEWKNKILQERFVRLIPIIGMILIVVGTIITIVVCRIQVSGLAEGYQKVQAQLEEQKQQEESQQKLQEEAVSALQLGRKVAELETDYSLNRIDVLREEQEQNDGMDDAISDLNQEQDGILDDLKSYFSDNSYKDAWYVGTGEISNPYWDFGTKYSMDLTEQESVPVVWACYDSQPGGLLLGYTTAVFDVSGKTFSDAETVLFDVSEDTSPQTGRPSSLLGVLQGDSVTVTSGESPESVLKNEEKNEESSSDESDDTTSQEEPSSEAESEESVEPETDSSSDETTEDVSDGTENDSENESSDSQTITAIE